MKILKYFLIIVVLSLVFLSVFIATEKSEYEIQVTHQTELSEQRLFRYVENLENFKDWNPWTTTSNNYQLDTLSKGKNAKIFWGENLVHITDSKANDFVEILMEVEGNIYNTKMYFNSKNDTTDILWKINGHLSFTEKIEVFFQGTPETLMAPSFDKGLRAIVHHLNQSIENYSIKSENLILFPETIYIKQMVTSNIESLGDKIFKSMEHLNTFAENFELEPYGAPLTMFENIDLQSGNVKYAVCMPIKNFFSTAAGSDVVCEQIEAFYGFKVVLNGDYVHSDKAWKEAKKQVEQLHLTQRTDIKPIAVFKKSILNIQKPDQWITEFIIPVNETFIPIIEKETDTEITK